MGFSKRQLQFIASLTRRVPVRGTARLLRRLHTPSSESAALEAVVSIGDGLKIHASTLSYIEWLLFFYGPARFEPGIRKVLRTYVKPGAFVIDVGANIGVHTLAMAKLALPGRVAAFEPSPGVRERLESNIQLNALTNIDVHPAAVGAEDGVVTLHVPTEDAGMSPYASLQPNPRYLSQSVTVSVPATRLDTFANFDGAPKVSLLKIDVEGLEPEVLAGAQAMLARDRPVLVIEYDKEWWSQAGRTFADVTAQLRSLGYISFSEITARGTRTIGRAVPGFMNVLAVGEPPDEPAQGVRAANL